MPKRLGILLSIFLIFISCDKEAIHEYYVQNYCEEVIIVNILDLNNKSVSIEIAPNTEKLIYIGKIINAVYEDDITYFIKYITIKKGNVISNIDLLDYRIWRFEQISQFKAKSYLTVNPEDFE